MVGIYRIISPTDKVYIGQTWNSSKRFSNYRKLKCEGQLKLYNSLKKHGFDNHIVEMIQEFPKDIEQKFVDIYEILYINQYRDCGIELLNLREGGSRGRCSEETKLRMSEASRNRNSWLHFGEYAHKGNTCLENKRQKGYYDNKRHPREYKVEQLDLNNNVVKVWESIRDISKELNYNSQNVSKAVISQNKYKNHYWKKVQ